PYLVLGLPAGALVDRWDHRRTMVVTSCLSGLTMASIPVAHWAGVLTTPHLLISAVLVASVFVFFDAASFGAVPAIVGRDAVAAATGAMVSVSTVVNLVGPAVGGVAAATVGAANVLALDVLSYLVGAILLSRVRWAAPAAADRSAADRSGADRSGPAGSRVSRTRRDIAEGLRYIRGHRLIRTLTLLGAGSSLSGGAVTGLVVVVAVRQFGLPDDDPRIGLLYVAAALGTLIVSQLLSRVHRHVPTGTITLGAFGASTLALIGWSLNTAWLPGMGILLLWQASTSLVILNGIVVRQAVTPLRLQARVNTAARMIAWGGTPLGAVLAGILADAWGTRAALLTASAGVGLALVAGLMAGLGHTGRLQDLIRADEVPANPPQAGPGGPDAEVRAVTAAE
ncbi:MFS transporter, partial [Frankia sp. CcWB2]